MASSPEIGSKEYVPGEVNEFGVRQVNHRAAGHVDGNTRIVGDPLTQPCQAIEQRAFSGIRATKKQYPPHDDAS